MPSDALLMNSKRISIRYAAELGRTTPLASPEEVIKALMRVSDEPKYENIFPNKKMPPALIESFHEARAARERYITELAHIVLEADPIPFHFRRDNDLERARRTNRVINGLPSR